MLRITKGLRKLSFFEDFYAYRSPLLAQGFWALQIYRFGTLRLKVNLSPIRKILAAVHLILSKLSEILFGIYIGRDAIIGKRMVIEHFGGIIIHNNAVLGDDVVIRQGVTIGNRRVDRPLDVPVIGSRVNIGAGAKILGSLRIGDDVSIGANAVVLVDVPARHIAVGVPATIKPRKKGQSRIFGEREND